MELIKPQKGTNYNIEHDIQNLTSIEQEFEQIDNKITNDITSSIDELKDKVDNDITTAITELDNKVDTEIVTAIDSLETKVNTEISESITALDNKVTTSLQEQAESLKKEISDQIAKVVANSPEDFDTLKEISDWISGHSSNAATMNSAISENTSAINQEISDRQAADAALQTNIDKKVDKIEGKVLSTNDYTTTEKNKLAGIESGANKTIVDNSLNSTSTNPVQNKVVNTALGNKVDKVSGKGLSTNDYTTTEKNKLAGIAEGANKTTVDTTLSDTSTNPVQNKVIYSALSSKANTSSVFVKTILSPTYGTSAYIYYKFKSPNYPILAMNDSSPNVIGFLTQHNPYFICLYNKYIENSSWTLTGIYYKKGYYYLRLAGYQALLLLSNTSISYESSKETDFLKADFGDSVNYETPQLMTKILSDELFDNKANKTDLNSYIKKLSVSGKTITYTKGDNSEETITTQDTTYSAATQSAQGLMSAADKIKLDGIAAGANKITVDTTMSSTSTNPVQNKVVNSALSSKANSDHTHTSLKRTQIASGTNLNSLTTPGEYYAIDNTTYTNAPCQNFTMQVINLMASYTFQILYAYSSNRIYTRSTIYNGGSVAWTNWIEFASTTDYLKIRTSAPTSPKAGDIWIG